MPVGKEEIWIETLSEGGEGEDKQGKDNHLITVRDWSNASASQGMPRTAGQ